MKFIFRFGAILQLIVSVWMLLNLSAHLSNLELIIIYAAQTLSAIICFFTYLKQSYKVANIFAICSVAFLILNIAKAKFAIVEIISFIPLILYYVVLSTYSSYQAKMQKFDQQQQTKDDNNLEKL